MCETYITESYTLRCNWTLRTWKPDKNTLYYQAEKVKRRSIAEYNLRPRVHRCVASPQVANCCDFEAWLKPETYKNGMLSIQMKQMRC